MVNCLEFGKIVEEVAVEVYLYYNVDIGYEVELFDEILVRESMLFS